VEVPPFKGRLQYHFCQRRTGQWPGLLRAVSAYGHGRTPQGHHMPPAGLTLQTCTLIPGPLLSHSQHLRYWGTAAAQYPSPHGRHRKSNFERLHNLDKWGIFLPEGFLFCLNLIPGRSAPVAPLLTYLAPSGGGIGSDTPSSYPGPGQLVAPLQSNVLDQCGAGPCTGRGGLSGGPAGWIPSSP
jgi:hypothetical protein